MIQQRLSNIKKQYRKLFNSFNAIKKHIPDIDTLKKLIQQKVVYIQRIEQLQFQLNDSYLQKTANFNTCKLTLEEEKILRSELEKLRFSQIEKTKSITDMKKNNEILGTELNRLKKKHETVLMELEKHKVIKEQIQEPGEQEVNRRTNG